jgi:3-oxoacyl-[acyl-carrier protein] reductase
MMNQKCALITGAAKGIGYGIAQSLAAERFDLFINDIVPPQDITHVLEELRNTGVSVDYIKADISVAEERQRIINALEKSRMKLTALVNNAGVAPKTREDILTASEESFERVLKINLQGPYFLTQAIAAFFIKQKQKSPAHFQCIVNIASSNSVAASVNRGEYCISKAGLSMSTKLWAVRLAEFDIPVYEIRPGLIETDMTRVVKDMYDKKIDQDFLLQKRWGQPKDVGKAVAMLTRGDLPYSTGQVLSVDGGQLIPHY